MLEILCIYCSSIKKNMVYEDFEPPNPSLVIGTKIGSEAGTIFCYKTVKTSIHDSR